MTECGSSSRYRQFGRELDSRYNVGLSLERRGRLMGEATKDGGLMPGAVG